MKHRKFFIFAIALFSSVQMFAQKEETVIGDRGLGFSGIWGGYDHQITRFGNTNSYVKGGFFGLEFGKSLFVGFSRYQLEEEIEWDQLATQPFELKYSGLKLGYGISSFKAIHPVFTLDLSPGKAKIELVDGVRRDNVFVVQPAAGLEINVLRWFHIGLTGGYRFVTDSTLPTLSDSDLSGAFGQATLKFGWSWGRSRHNQKSKSDKND